MIFLNNKFRINIGFFFIKGNYWWIECLGKVIIVLCLKIGIFVVKV